jgi:hypothetical protein
MVNGGGAFGEPASPAAPVPAAQKRAHARTLTHKRTRTHTRTDARTHTHTHNSPDTQHHPCQRRHSGITSSIARASTLKTQSAIGVGPGLAVRSSPSPVHVSGRAGLGGMGDGGLRGWRAN